MRIHGTWTVPIISVPLSSSNCSVHVLGRFVVMCLWLLCTLSYFARLSSCMKKRRLPPQRSPPKCVHSGVLLPFDSSNVAMSSSGGVKVRLPCGFRRPPVLWNARWVSDLSIWPGSRGHGVRSLSGPGRAWLYRRLLWRDLCVRCLSNRSRERQATFPAHSSTLCAFRVECARGHHQQHREDEQRLSEMKERFT